MEDEELKRRLGRRFAMWERQTPEVPTLSPASEQSLGRVMERIEMLEKQLDLTYKVIWRTSAAVMGLVTATFGWDWVAKLLRSLQ